MSTPLASRLQLQLRPFRRLVSSSSSSSSAITATTTSSLSSSSLSSSTSLLRRHASTSTAQSAAQSAQSTANSARSQAADGLSRVVSAAGPAVGRVGEIVGRVGGRTGRVIRVVEEMIPPTVYYAKVGLELGKLVFQGRKMQIPSSATVQSYLAPLSNPQTLLHNLSTASPASLMQRVRTLNHGQLATGAVVFAEVLGFFTVGEMLGRMKIVGYRGDVEHH